MKHLALILSLSFCLTLHAEDMNFTIQGQATDKAELETLSPSPDIPSADDLLFSLDGGKSAREGEVVPLDEFKAALLTDPAKVPPATLPLIPTTPFVTQPLPLGDEYDVKRNEIFSEKNADNLATLDWEFNIVDENNNTIHKVTGQGRPPNPLSWDGTSDGAFVLKPNTNYISFLVLRATEGIVGTWPGDAVRFMATARFESENLLIEFGEKVYEKDTSLISPSAEIMMGDLARRLFVHASKSNPINYNWKMVMSEPAANLQNGMAEERKETWQARLEEVLNKRIPSSQIDIQSSESETGVLFILEKYDSAPEPSMLGRPSLPRPKFENKSSWVDIKEVKNTLIIGLRHDRLFLPGSAFLRDEALPQLANALALVRKQNETELKLAEKMSFPLQEKRRTKKEEKKFQKKMMKLEEERIRTTRHILLRSYAESVHDKKRNKKEADPKLAALRTKVLFMLFSKERFLISEN